LPFFGLRFIPSILQPASDLDRRTPTGMSVVEQSRSNCRGAPQGSKRELQSRFESIPRSPPYLAPDYLIVGALFWAD
jgi:hypothetical protein